MQFTKVYKNKMERIDKREDGLEFVATSPISVEKGFVTFHDAMLFLNTCGMKDARKATEKIMLTAKEIDTLYAKGKEVNLHVIRCDFSEFMVFDEKCNRVFLGSYIATLDYFNSIIL